MSEVEEPSDVERTYPDEVEARLKDMIIFEVLSLMYPLDGDILISNQYKFRIILVKQNCPYHF